ncbi:MAG: hypothetical protein E7607_07300 [Ruminococcaceae bacterium]|nr:hypothetical protein [Oscillospiraceae bacterium]
MKTIRLISLLLCILLIVPMLFACGKEDDSKGEDPAAATPDGEIQLPDYICQCNMVVDVTYAADPNQKETVTYTTIAGLNGDNFRIYEAKNGMEEALTFCDNVLYINMYGEKYKIDFNSFDLENVYDMVLDYVTSPSELAIGERTATMYAATLGMPDADAPAVDSDKNLIFKNVNTVIAPDGTETVIYKGIHPKVAALIDKLLALVMGRTVGSETAIIIDYDALTLSVSGGEENAALSLEFDADLMDGGELYAEAHVKVNSQCNIGNVDPIVAPEDAAEYENALPLIMSELIGGLADAEDDKRK